MGEAIALWCENCGEELTIEERANLTAATIFYICCDKCAEANRSNLDVSGGKSEYIPPKSP